MPEQERKFSQDYFESGKQVLGQYASYDGRRFYPAFEATCKTLKLETKANKILDIGCAKGFLVDVLRQNGFDAYGTDISQYAVDACPASIGRYLAICDLNKDQLPFHDASFDFIVCMGTLEYVENQKHALSEIKRVLANGGTLLMTTLGYVPEGDEFRKFAKSSAQWDNAFKGIGFKPNHPLAKKIFSRYVRKIIEFDFGNSLLTSTKKTLKFRLGKFIFFHTKLREIIITYLFNKQVESGYLMLGYSKS